LLVLAAGLAIRPTPGQSDVSFPRFESTRGSVGKIKGSSRTSVVYTSTVNVASVRSTAR